MLNKLKKIEKISQSSMPQYIIRFLFKSAKLTAAIFFVFPKSFLFWIESRKTPKTIPVFISATCTVPNESSFIIIDRETYSNKKLNVTRFPKIHCFSYDKVQTFVIWTINTILTVGLVLNKINWKSLGFDTVRFALFMKKWKQ